MHTYGALLLLVPAFARLNWVILNCQRYPQIDVSCFANLNCLLAVTIQSPFSSHKCPTVSKVLHCTVLLKGETRMLIRGGSHE